MAGDIKEDLKQIKLFKDAYKKCKVISPKDAKEAEDCAKSIKYFGHDMRGGLEVLEEVIAEKKTDPEAVKSKKIEDYAVYKEVREILKDVKFNLKKVVDAAKDLDKLEKSAGVEASKKKLNHLLKTIQLDTKLRKGGKPEKIVVNLQKQIEADLNLLDNYYADIKKILPSYPKLPDYQKEYDKEVSSIAIIKPRLSSRTQKYIKLAPKMLDPKILKSTVAKCEKLAKSLETIATEAKAAATAKDEKKFNHLVPNGIKTLAEIEKIDQDYSKIAKKYSKEIDSSVNKKVVDKAVKAIEDIWNEADDHWDKTSSEIAKTRKEQKNQPKKK